jgi:uncharacterized C2H2 Zn-finger protein
MSINYQCEHCDTVFKKKSALNYHQNKAKYCLLIQEKIEPENEPDEEIFKCSKCEKLLSTKQNLELHFRKCNIKEKEVFQCSFCDKILSTKQNLTNHLSVCFEKQERELKQLRELREQNNKEIFDKDKIIIKINTQLENYKEQLEKQEENYKEQLEKQEEQIKDLQEKLDKIANKAIDRPTTVVSNTTTNNNLNIMSSLDFNNFDKIKDAIENKLNVNHVVDGQKGLAKFMVDTILTDDEGNLLYVCTDSSRNIFKYKNSNGEINKDVEAKKLISFMVNAGIKVKSFDIAREWYKNGDENGDVDITKHGIMVSPQEKIMTIEDDSCCFKRELASMTSN